MPVKTLAKAGLVALLLVATTVVAEEALSQAFLDYMLEFQTEEGEWIDPEELELMAQLGTRDEDSQPQQKVNADED